MTTSPRAPVAIVVALASWRRRPRCSQRRHGAAGRVGLVHARASTRVPLGSPVDLTYRFDVAPRRQDRRRLPRVRAREERRRRACCGATTTIRRCRRRSGSRARRSNTRARASCRSCRTSARRRVEIGLYRDNERLPLQGPDPADRESTSRDRTSVGDAAAAADVRERLRHLQERLASGRVRAGQSDADLAVDAEDRRCSTFRNPRKDVDALPRVRRARRTCSRTSRSR